MFRVDMRLRPFGEPGPLVVSFAPSRTTCSSTGATGSATPTSRRAPCTARGPFGELYRDVVRPFVFRRYLDFGVFESLREMKALIAREVERRELRDNVKLGPGGIREIEFIVQAFQLIRGGGKPALQTPSLLEALPRLAGAKLLTPRAVEELGDCLRFLRRVENRLQMCDDAQTHDLPQDERGPRAPGARDGLRRTGRRCAAELDAAPAARERAFPGADLRARASRAPAAAVGPCARGAAGAGTRRRRARRELLARRRHRGRRRDVLARLEVLRQSAYWQRLDESGRRRLQTLLPELLRGDRAAARGEAGWRC